MDDSSMDAALARLPEWQPRPGFAARVAAEAASQGHSEWIPLLLRGMGIAASVSVAAWLGAELIYAGLQATPDSQAGLGWVLGIGSLLLAWHLVRQPRVPRITS